MSFEEGLGRWFREQIDAWTETYKREEQAQHVCFRDLMPALSGDKLTHQLHPYPAKLLSQIPAFFLTAWPLTAKGSAVVADPFCGSGTVLLEAAMLGNATVGADVNPLARLITTVKLNSPSESRVRLLLGDIVRSHEVATPRMPKTGNLAFWYSKKTLVGLSRLRGALDLASSGPERDFLLVAFAVCCRRLSLADPRISVPVRINVQRFDKYGNCSEQLRRHLDYAKRADVLATYLAICERNLVRLRRAAALRPSDRRHFIYSEARTLETNHGIASVDAIITSPPYLGAQKYIRSSSLALVWIGLAEEAEIKDLKSKSIGREYFRKRDRDFIDQTGIPEADAIIESVRINNSLRAKLASQYLKDMRVAIRSSFRLLKPGGKMVMVCGSGSVAGLKFETPNFLMHVARQEGFEIELQLKDDIRARALMTKRNRTAGMIASEGVVLLGKPK